MSKTTKVVSDGCEKRKLPAELLGQIEIKKNEIIRRLEEGTLPLNRTMTELQAIVEGRVVTKVQLKDVLDHVRPNASFDVHDLLCTIGQKLGVTVDW